MLKTLFVAISLTLGLIAINVTYSIMEEATNVFEVATR